MLLGFRVVSWAEENSQLGVIHLKLVRSVEDLTPGLFCEIVTTDVDRGVVCDLVVYCRDKQFDMVEVLFDLRGFRSEVGQD